MESSKKLLIKRVVMYTLLSALCMVALGYYNQSTVYEIIFATTLLAFLLSLAMPLSHEYAHKLAYERVNDKARVTIHIGKSNWCVKDESEEWFSKSEMIMVLLSPLMVSMIAFAVYCATTGLASFAFYLASILNLVGMLQDIFHTGIILTDRRHVLFRYENGMKLIKQ